MALNFLTYLGPRANEGASLPLVAILMNTASEVIGTGTLEFALNWGEDTLRRNHHETAAGVVRFCKWIAPPIIGLAGSLLMNLPVTHALFATVSGYGGLGFYRLLEGRYIPTGNPAPRQ